MKYIPKDTNKVGPDIDDNHIHTSTATAARSTDPLGSVVEGEKDKKVEGYIEKETGSASGIDE